MSDAERKEDIPLQLILASGFEKYTRTRGCYPWLADNIAKMEKGNAAKPPRPDAAWRRPFWRLLCYDWFETMFSLLIIINMIPIIWEMVEFFDKVSSCDEKEMKTRIFFGVNVAFTILFTFEWFINVSFWKYIVQDSFKSNATFVSR
jgi:hypothetical protein